MRDSKYTVQSLPVSTAFTTLALAVSAISGCGGNSTDDSVARPAHQSAGVSPETTGQWPTRLGGPAVAPSPSKTSGDPSTELDTPVIFELGSGGWIDPGGIFPERFTKFDLVGVRFQFVSCGIYARIGSSSGYLGIEPLAMIVKIARADLPKMVALGGRIQGLDGMGVQAVGPCSNEDASFYLADVSRVANWAAAMYPQDFPGRPVYPGAWNDYQYYRFYGSPNYIGVKEGRVFVHNGSNWNFLDVGAITDYIPTIAGSQASR